MRSRPGSDGAPGRLPAVFAAARLHGGRPVRQCRRGVRSGSWRPNRVPARPGPVSRPPTCCRVTMRVRSMSGRSGSSPPGATRPRRGQRCGTLREAFDENDPESYWQWRREIRFRSSCPWRARLRRGGGADGRRAGRYRQRSGAPGVGRADRGIRPCSRSGTTPCGTRYGAIRGSRTSSRGMRDLWRRAGDAPGGRRGGPPGEREGPPGPG